MPGPNPYFRFALETGSLPRLLDHLVGAADINWCWFPLIYYMRPMAAIPLLGRSCDD